MNVLGKYKNGNFSVVILNDGTKIRYNNLDSFNPDKPESMDLTISTYCEMGCEFCYAKCSRNGRHADIMAHSFIDNLWPYTELALNGNEPLHPDLIPFLHKCRDLKLIPSLTVNQYTFMKNIDTLEKLSNDKLIYGLGVSLKDANQEFIEAIKKFPNSVIHVIAGVIEENELLALSGNGLKILILGYKTVGRGVDYFYDNEEDIASSIDDLHNLLPEIVNDEWFDVVSFDNLAIEQLEPQRLMSEEEWTHMYMGSDGFATFYVDMVEGKFSKSSTSTEYFDIMDDPKYMFDKVREV